MMAVLFVVLIIFFFCRYYKKKCRKPKSFKSHHNVELADLSGLMLPEVVSPMQHQTYYCADSSATSPDDTSPHFSHHHSIDIADQQPQAPNFEVSFNLST
jgi:hypothetical protein